MTDWEAVRRMLKESVQLLASDMQTQLAYLTAPEHGVRAEPDELALNFDDEYRLVPQLEEKALLTKEAVDRLRELDAFLDAMSGRSNAALWTYEALETETWAKVRALARAAFDELPR